MNFYVFSPLLNLPYKQMKCLGGPFQTKQEALKAVEMNKWQNWIISLYPYDISPGVDIHLETVVNDEPTN